jgi:hypothetical protein
LTALWLAISDFLDPTQGPEQEGGFRVSPSFFIALFGIGFLVAVFGHIIRSRTLVMAGVLMVFLATVVVPIALHLAN